MKPFRIDPDGIPLFTNLQIDDYGMPELWGYYKYHVIESREGVFVSDYKMEQERYIQKTHRYSREARFKVCLLNLLGERGRIPEMVITMVKTSLNPGSNDKWNDTRRILKHYKQRRYYDNIPLILRMLKYERLFKPITSEKFEELINDYKCLSTRFESIKTGRRYFPNIRYVVFKLLELHDINPNYPIPFARTSRKLKSLNELWSNLCDLNKNG
jgi:hypothetical protein